MHKIFNLADQKMKDKYQETVGFEGYLSNQESQLLWQTVLQNNTN